LTLSQAGSSRSPACRRPGRRLGRPRNATSLPNFRCRSIRFEAHFQESVRECSGGISAVQIEYNNGDRSRRGCARMQFGKQLAAFTLCGAALLAQSIPVPSVEINYPGLNPNRYIDIAASFPLHAVNGQMAGFTLARFLETAGWGQIPIDTVSQYLVRLDGDATATFPLSQVLSRSLVDRVRSPVAPLRTPPRRKLPHVSERNSPLPPESA